VLFLNPFVLISKFDELPVPDLILKLDSFFHVFVLVASTLTELKCQYNVQPK
jgi:hypothetical protein